MGETKRQWKGDGERRDDKREDGRANEIKKGRLNGWEKKM